MVDTSSSVGGDENFQLVIKFVISIFHSFTLGGGVRYGLLAFSSSVKVCGQTDYHSFSKLVEIVPLLRCVSRPNE